MLETYIFDVWTRVDSHNITMLDTEVVSDHTVHTSASIIQLIIGKDNKNGVLALLALHQNSVATEEL